MGEELDPDGVTAYTLAVKNGYRKSETEWIRTLTNVSVKEVSQTPYQVARANSFDGSLSQWLTGMVKNPEDLGKSHDGNPTDYEYACSYGYTGTFIEWLVSLSSDPIY